MLRKRLITVLTLNEGVLFRTKVFQPDYRYTLNFVDAWSIDEIVILDVTRSERGNNASFLETVGEIATKCFVPVAAGGGVKTLVDVKRMLDHGADKVVMNTGALANPDLITQAARAYGSQCVVVSIDAKKNESSYEVYADCGRLATGLSPQDWARRAAELGAGEIMITSMEKDGSLEGYDLELTQLVSSVVNIPVLACGGAGKWQDFVDGIVTGKASAACTANIYHFTEASIRSAKSYMSAKGVDVRL